MGRKRATLQEAAAAVISAAQETDQAADALEIEAEETTEDMLEGLRRLDQGGNRINWSVYCDAPLEREGFIEKLRTEQLDEQRFKTKYGPGEYRVVGRTTDGHYVKGSHRVLKISGIMAEQHGAQTTLDPIGFLREMRAAEEQRAQQRREEFKNQAAIWAPALATLGAALIQRRPAIDVAALITALRPAQSSLSEMTTALLNLKNMQGDQSSGLDTVLKVIDKLQDLPTGGAGDTSWVSLVRDVLKEAAPVARDLLTQHTQTPRPPLTSGPPFMMTNPQLSRPPTSGNGASAPTNTASAPSVSLPSAPSAAPPAGTTQPMTNEGQTVFQTIEPWLRRRAEDMHEWATINMEVELAAETLLATVPKMFRAFLSPAELVTLLQSPDWWEHVKAFHPPLTPYQAWVDDVRGELLALLQEEISGVPDANGAESGGT